MITAGIDVGSGAVKAVVMGFDPGDERVLSRHVARIRRRDIRTVVDEVCQAAVRGAGVDNLDYVATTGEGEDVPFATGPLCQRTYERPNSPPTMTRPRAAGPRVMRRWRTSSGALPILSRMAAYTRPISRTARRESRTMHRGSG